MQINTIIKLNTTKEKRNDVYLITVDSNKNRLCSPDYIEYKINSGIKSGAIQTANDMFDELDYLFGKGYHFCSMNNSIIDIKI